MTVESEAAEAAFNEWLADEASERAERQGDELTRLRARVAELEADAERYQYVKRRAKRLHQMFVIDMDISEGPTDFGCAIDAARLREGREQC